MRSHAKCAVFFLLLFAFALDTLSAQRNVPQRDNPAATFGKVPGSGKRHEDPAAVRLLTLDEGLSVLGAALESRAHLGVNSDCSHLVHAVYERAGFPYPYASSSDLYLGISEFHRVPRPQPGDLVAWPGHVGIAISPVQHSFYSALHSGMGVEKYDAPYWRKRGRARFYRYVKAVPATVHAADARIARMTPATFGGAELDDDQEKNGMKTQPATAPLEVRATNQPIPRMAVVDSERPGADEITEALSQAFSDTAAALRGRDVLTLPQPLIAFDRVEVERVHIERGQGWAAVKIRRPLPVTAEQGKHQKPAERQRWPLRRRDQYSWEVVLPQGGIYLPRDAAVRVLAHQLTDLADDPAAPSGGRKKAQLARLLNALLQR
jgi:NlpC/P60 family